MQEWCWWWGVRAWKIFQVHKLSQHGPSAPPIFNSSSVEVLTCFENPVVKGLKACRFFVTFAPAPKILESMIKPGRYASSWPDFKPSTQHHWTCSKVLPIAIGKHMHLVRPNAGCIVKPLNGSHRGTLIQFEWTGPLTFFPLTNRIAFSHNPPCLNWRKIMGKHIGSWWED